MRPIMQNNKKAYKIYMTLPKEERKKLSVEHEIAEIDNLEDKDWLNRFGNWKNGHNGSFWNWLWMIHFKQKYKNINIDDIGENMTNKDLLESVFPQDKQIGGSHYKDFPIQPYEFISKNDLSFFQGNVIKYVCRYKHKNGIEDLEKIKHYCDLEILKMKDGKKRK